MTSRRVRHFNELILRKLSLLLTREVKDSRLSDVTITDVDLTGDLRIARVYISILDNDREAREEMLHIVRDAAGFLRRELAQVLHVRHTPELDFRLDESSIRGERIEQLLEQIHQDNQTNPPPQETA